MPRKAQESVNHCFHDYSKTAALLVVEARSFSVLCSKVCRNLQLGNSDAHASVHANWAILFDPDFW